MKKTISILTLLIYFCLLGFSQEANNDNKDKYLMNYFYLAPLPAIYNTFQISYERYLGNTKKSLLISAGILADGYNDNIDLGFTDEIQLRLYLNDIKNSGKVEKFQFAFYFSPFIAHKYLNRNDSYTKYNYSNTVSAGLVSGWKGVYNRFAFDIFVGGGFKKSKTNINDPVFIGSDILDDNFTGVYPKVGIQFGFSF